MYMSLRSAAYFKAIYGLITYLLLAIIQEPVTIIYTVLWNRNYPTGPELDPIDAGGVGVAVASFAFVCGQIGLACAGKKLSLWSATLGDSKSQNSMKLVSAALLLSFGLAGFWILPRFGAVLWLLFLIISFPVSLAYIRKTPSRDENLVAIYRDGLKEIPIISRLLGETSKSENAESTSVPDTEEIDS